MIKESLQREETMAETERRLVADAVLRFVPALKSGDKEAIADEILNLEVYAEIASTPKLRKRCREALKDAAKRWPSLVKKRRS